MAKVYARRWDDVCDVYELVEVRMASNGVVEVRAIGGDGQARTIGIWAAFWTWHSEGAADFYGYVDELGRLPGWSDAMRELIFENLEARRTGRRRRWAASMMGEETKDKGSAFPRRNNSEGNNSDSPTLGH